MPRFTPAASATSRTVSPAQPRCGSSSRPAASRARSRFLEGRGGMGVTIRTYNYVVKRLESAMPRIPLALARSRSNEGDAEGALTSLREAEALAADDPGTWREIGQ